jgi:integrase/recombinase XerD
LNLKPLQIIEFLTYTQTTKQYLSKRIKTHNDEQLIYGSIDQIRTIGSRIIKNLKKYNNKVKNLNQIRSSIIINWLSQNNLRKTQYLAGHRYISSTERYQQDDLENLHEIVNNYHPIS